MKLQVLSAAGALALATGVAAAGESTPAFGRVTEVRSDGPREEVVHLEADAILRVKYPMGGEGCGSLAFGCYAIPDNVRLRSTAPAAALVLEESQGRFTFWFVLDNRFEASCGTEDCGPVEFARPFVVHEVGEWESRDTRAWSMPSGTYRMALLSSDGSPVEATLDLDGALPEVSDIELDRPTPGALAFDHQDQRGLVHGDALELPVDSDGGFAALGMQLDAGPGAKHGSAASGEPDLVYGFAGLGFASASWPVADLSHGGTRILSEVLPVGYQGQAAYEFRRTVLDLQRSVFLLDWPTVVGVD